MSDANASLLTSSEKIRFETRNGERHFQTLFVEPAFTLFQNLPGLSHHVFARLTRHGLRLADMRFEVGNGSLAEHQLTCSVLNYSTSVRFRIDTVEISSFNLRQLSEDHVGEIAIDALEALRLYSAATIFATYQLTLAAHGVLAGASGQEFVRRFTNPPEGAELGPLTGSGVALYFGECNERVRSTVTVDVSANIANGLFVRPFAVWDAQKTPLRSLPKLAASFIVAAFDQVGLVGP